MDSLDDLFFDQHGYVSQKSSSACRLTRPSLPPAKDDIFLSQAYQKNTTWKHFSKTLDGKENETGLPSCTQSSMGPGWPRLQSVSYVKRDDSIKKPLVPEPPPATSLDIPLTQIFRQGTLKLPAGPVKTPPVGVVPPSKITTQSRRVPQQTGQQSKTPYPLDSPLDAAGDSYDEDIRLAPSLNHDQNLQAAPLSQEELDTSVGNARPPFAHPETPAYYQSQNDFIPRPHAITPFTQEIPSCTPGGTDDGGILRLKPVTEIPDAYRKIFSFPYFNKVQSKVFDSVLYTDKPIVICAPTGSGKTVIFELAIVRQLIKYKGKLPSTCKTVYMAPIKALCTERYEDWQRKFGPLGLKCKELTGDTELDDFYELQDVHIILTTPEKWDSMTRRWRDNRSLVQQVEIFMIDEIHMLNDASRGATMEAVVSRMKTVKNMADSEDSSNLAMIPHVMAGASPTSRFIAVSATIPNVEDIADWLSAKSMEAVSVNLDDSCRPVRLRKVVLGYPCSQSFSEFRFDLSLNYKLASVIGTYSDQKPTLVFCATRKGVQQAASTLVKEARFVMNAQHKQRLVKHANMVKDGKLRDLVICGVGYHHAGLDINDRKIIEGVFTQGDLPVLMATSTLAMGVNMPAHLVVVKSTLFYNMGGFQEYSEAQVLQMIGRAGRPQFDTTATAVIMTRTATKSRYEALLNGTQLIESSLHQNLVEHLNAEIVLHTICDINVALHWIRSTFLYIRVMKNPKHYGIPEGLKMEQVENRLQELCLKNLNSLAEVSLISMETDGFTLKPTELGTLMARYCVAFETMKKFNGVAGTETLCDLLNMLCSSKEFRDVKLRTNEKKILNTLNKDKNRPTIRFPMTGKIKTTEMKVSCLIQAQLGCLQVQDFGLTQDINKISRAAIRISRCLMEILWQRTQYTALLNAVLLNKVLKAKLWETSKHVSRQLTGIGMILSTALVNAGIVSFQKIEEKHPRELELIMNRHPPFGNQVKDAASRLPKYELLIDQAGHYGETLSEITITISMTNKELVSENSSLGSGHTCILLIGDADNHVVYKARISDSVLLRNSWTRHISLKRAKAGEELQINLISQTTVGIDVQSVYTPFYTGPKRVNNSSTAPGNSVNTQGKNKGALPTPKNTPGRKPLKFVNPKDPELDPEPESGRRRCSHACYDKRACSHTCCKVGVPVKTPRIGSVESFRQQLKHRLADMQPLPFKRPKIGSSDLHRYAYTKGGVRQQAVNQMNQADNSIRNSCYFGQDISTPVRRHDDVSNRSFDGQHCSTLRHRPTVAPGSYSSTISSAGCGSARNGDTISNKFYGSHCMKWNTESSHVTNEPKSTKQVEHVDTSYVQHGGPNSAGRTGLEVHSDQSEGESKGEFSDEYGRMYNHAEDTNKKQKTLKQQASSPEDFQEHVSSTRTNKNFWVSCVIPQNNEEDFYNDDLIPDNEELPNISPCRPRQRQNLNPSTSNQDSSTKYCRNNQSRLQWSKCCSDTSKTGLDKEIMPNSRQMDLGDESERNVLAVEAENEQPDTVLEDEDFSCNWDEGWNEDDPGHPSYVPSSTHHQADHQKSRGDKTLFWSIATGMNTSKYRAELHNQNNEVNLRGQQQTLIQPIIPVPCRDKQMRLNCTAGVGTETPTFSGNSHLYHNWTPHEHHDQKGMSEVYDRYHGNSDHCRGKVQQTLPADPSISSEEVSCGIARTNMLSQKITPRRSHPMNIADESNVDDQTFLHEQRIDSGVEPDVDCVISCNPVKRPTLEDLFPSKQNPKFLDCSRMEKDIELKKTLRKGSELDGGYGVRPNHLGLPCCQRASNVSVSGLSYMHQDGSAKHAVDTAPCIPTHYQHQGHGHMKNTGKSHSKTFASQMNVSGSNREQRKSHTSEPAKNGGVCQVQNERQSVSLLKPPAPCTALERATFDLGDLDGDISVEENVFAMIRLNKDAQAMGL